MQLGWFACMLVVQVVSHLLLPACSQGGGVCGHFSDNVLHFPLGVCGIAPVVGAQLCSRRGRQAGRHQEVWRAAAVTVAAPA